MTFEDLRGELLYEYSASFTKMIEYGTSLQQLLSGRAPIPAMGARVDIAFEGDVRGKVSGRLDAIDYLNIRADGRMELDLKGTLTTPDGARIAFAAGGICLPQAGSRQSLLRENVRLTTSHSDYAWLNTLEIWAVGHADVASGTVHVRGYIPA